MGLLSTFQLIANYFKGAICKNLSGKITVLMLCHSYVTICCDLGISAQVEVIRPKNLSCTFNKRLINFEYFVF